MMERNKRIPVQSIRDILVPLFVEGLLVVRLFLTHAVRKGTHSYLVHLEVAVVVDSHVDHGRRINRMLMCCCDTVE